VVGNRARTARSAEPAGAPWRLLSFDSVAVRSHSVQTVSSPASESPVPAPAVHRDFIREMVAHDVATNRFGRQVATRFPPEPNGFPHIGHVKAICLNFGIRDEFGGRCNLRFDDTNPAGEDMKYVEAFKRDIRWLGFEWDEELYASDYFEQLYRFGELLVEKGSAY